MLSLSHAELSPKGYWQEGCGDGEISLGRELPQVSFLSRQMVCRNKHDKTRTLSRQIFVATNIIL